MIKNGLIILLFLLPVVAFAQYPNNPNKIRLGFQTTGNGLIYRGSGAPTLFPTGYNSAFQFYDTIANTLWVYQDSFWYLTNTIRRSTPPPYSSVSSGLTLVYGHGVWQDTDDYHRYEYVANDSIEAWVPATGTYYWPSEPSDIAATGSTGAVKYTAGLWHKVPTDSLFRYDGSDWVFIGADGSVNYLSGDAGTVQVISNGDTINIVGGYGMNTSAGATDAVTVTADTAQLATPYDVSVVQDDINAHELADGDLSATNEIQQIDTLSLSGTTLSASLSSDGAAAKTVNLSPILSGYVTGSGTAGRVPRWTSSSALGDGVLRDDGTLLALGGGTVAGYSFYDYSTGGWRLPVGTTAQRPTAQTGAHRYNSSLGYSETYGSSEWLQSDFPVGTSGQTLRHNGTGWIANSNIWNNGSSIQLGGTTSNNYVGVGVVPTGTNALVHIRGVNNQGINRSRLLIGNTTAPALHQTGNDQICASLTVYADWETDTKAPPVFGGGGQTGIYAAASQWVQASSQAILGYNSISTGGAGSHTWNQFSQGWAGYFLNRNSGVTLKMTDGLDATNRRDWFFYGTQSTSSQSGITVNANNLGISANTYTYGGAFSASAPVNTADAAANNTVYGITSLSTGGKISYGTSSAASGASLINIGIIASGSGGTNNWGVYSSAGQNGMAGNLLINSAITTTSTAAQTLHVQGTVRITGSDGTPVTIAGRDADGDIGNVTIGSGLNLSGGVLSATGTGTVTGSGTTDYIPKFTSSTALGNSVLQESSSKIGIGVTPAHTLDMESATDAIDLPGGTTAQRPTNESELLRYNSDNARVEYADGTNWRDLTPTTSTTGSTMLASGTTAQRDGSPSNGYIRYNSTTGQLEAYVQSAWANISASPRSYADMVSSGAAQYTVVSTEVIDTVTNIVASGFTHSNGVLTYTGTTNKNFLVNISAVVGEADTDAATAVLRLYQNSSIKGVSQMYCALQDEKYSMSISRIVTLATNDTLDCRLATGGDWIVSNFYFNVTPID